MIITCPACNTQFNADPALFGPAGRKVRCARCAHVWRAGADGLPVPEAPAPEVEPPLAESVPPVPGPEVAGEPAGAAEVGVKPAVTAESPGEAAVTAPEGGLVTSARELLEREPVAGPSALPTEAPGEEAAAPEVGAAGKSVLLSAGTKEEGREARADAEQAALAKLSAKRAQQRGKRKKGGRKFQIFLLVLCLVVIALLAVAHFTGSFGPDGGGEGQDVPAVSDTPSPGNTGEVGSKPAEGGHIIGGKD